MVVECGGTIRLDALEFRYQRIELGRETRGGQGPIREQHHHRLVQRGQMVEEGTGAPQGRLQGLASHALTGVDHQDRGDGYISALERHQALLLPTVEDGEALAPESHGRIALPAYRDEELLQGHMQLLGDGQAVGLQQCRPQAAPAAPGDGFEAPIDVLLTHIDDRAVGRLPEHGYRLSIEPQFDVVDGLVGEAHRGLSRVAQSYDPDPTGTVRRN